MYAKTESRKCIIIIEGKLPWKLNKISKYVSWYEGQGPGSSGVSSIPSQVACRWIHEGKQDFQGYKVMINKFCSYCLQCSNCASYDWKF